ncbi:MAG: DUF4393 domain-containing protein [Leptolyngbya sp. SIO3F4]|nr:DUF4393 domain-containing protein [Leptolyngbya sp. SIO3F4]
MADDILGVGKAADALSKPLQEFLNKLLGPAAEEAGELFADRVRYLRWKNSLHIVEQANKLLETRGITPQHIPLKTLVPILEGASLESDDENLKSKWSNLLTNAASGKSVHPSYPKILTEIIHPEARILDYLFILEGQVKSITDEIEKLDKKEKHEQWFLKRRELSKFIQKFKISEIQQKFSFPNESFFGFIDNLLRLKLCTHPEYIEEVEIVTGASLDSVSNTKTDGEWDPPEYQLDVENQSIKNYEADINSIRLTMLGEQLLSACQGLSVGSQG